MSQYSYLSEPDPELFALIAKEPIKTSGAQDLAARREWFNNVYIRQIMEHHRPNLPQESEYRVHDYQVAEKVFPLFFWIHGGGWVFGTLDMDDYYLRILCVDLQICIVNVEFRLAPEYPFPIGLNDCYAALKWASTNQHLFSASSSLGFLLGGQSGGGNLAAAIAHRARDDPFFKKYPITGQILQIPVLLHADAAPEEYKSELLSVEQNKDAPGLLNRTALYWFYDQVQGPPSDPEFSPLLYPSHKGLPPLYIQICGLDPLRDEGLLYERVLREQHVKTKIDVYPGTVHGFHLNFPTIAAGVKYDKDLRAGIKWLLSLHT
ncbi:hypothetical protein AcV7_005349 [Taiwanofungus camphoratus]|nr:hypothetical protein AcV7_005349 [Antrodia cinnamomea]